MKNAKVLALVSLLSLSGIAIASSGCGSCSSTGCKVEIKEEETTETKKVAAKEDKEAEEEILEEVSVEVEVKEADVKE